MFTGIARTFATVYARVLESQALRRAKSIGEFFKADFPIAVGIQNFE